jgi:O-antigen/teichoic acid export membrane protein
MLFVRMMVITAINLYAVRLLLRNLGQEDYGTFNAVAGVVLASSFITTTLAVSIQRFYSYTLGKGENNQLSTIFSASINIILVLSIALLFIFETIGLWFVNNELSIPPERLVAANWVFHFSLITLWFGLLQLPFTAAIFAQEEMGAFALISLTECMLRLGVIFFIGITAMDGLIFYSIGLSAVAVIIFLLYAFIVHRRYPEYKYCRKIPKETYRSLLAFSGWTMYSALAAVGMTQGITILLYMFFGPIATAAYAIAQQVFHAFTALSNSIVVAFRPAMVKSFAEKDYTSLNKMFIANNKFILYLLLMVAIPLILELRTIFDWWLGNVSEEAIIYTRLTIIYLLCFSMHNPVTTIVQSTGQLRHYSLYVDSILLLCLPATWLAFHLGASSEISIALMIVMCFAAHFVRLIILHNQYPSFRYGPYISEIILRGLFVAVCTFFVVYLVHQALHPGIVRLVTVFASSCITMLLTVYFLGLSAKEQQTLCHFLMQRMNKYSEN